MMYPSGINGTRAKTLSRSDWVGWRLYCDVPKCKNASDLRPSQTDFNLHDFQAQGWFISAAREGDICPTCRADGHKPIEEPYKSPRPV